MVANAARTSGQERRQFRDFPAAEGVSSHHINALLRHEQASMGDLRRKRVVSLG
ncbi:hypothetical protein [Kutzneria kofuensis]|uniref:Uncharacterized protein n=1 Tax=Kutzneria kofuensis TaxID=103725 RepID=A0A7W9NKE4_9PSEU|nr:hypothetical protein [Kutzneria kofuensis]MBB5896557.1 hypothetical protein [Kutzneria kofuensis]